MLLSEIKAYLQTKYSHPNINFKWTPDDNEDFFKYIRKNFPKDHLKDDKNKEIVEQAFKNYFENVGYITFQLNDNQISLKVFPYTIHPKDSIHLQETIEILQNNKDLIEFNYRKNENQIFIPKELKKKLDISIENNNNDEEINKKELIKYAIRKNLELEANDIVIFKQDNIFIKLVSKIKKRQINLKEKESIVNRYNGIDEQELILFYDEYFSQEENKNFFKQVAHIFGKRYFIDILIDNEDYEKNVFKYIQKITMEELKHTFESDEEFLKGFSGYVFRIHFQDVFKYIADFILYELSISNVEIEKFLQYYSLNMIVHDGIKYKVPELKVSDNLNWNIASIITISKSHIKANALIEEMQEKIFKLEEYQSKMLIDGISPVVHNNDLITKKNIISEYIIQDSAAYNVVSHKYNAAKTEEEKIELQAELVDMKEELEYLKENKEDFESLMVELSIITKYKKIDQDINILKNQVRSQFNKLKESQDNYEKIRLALSKVLIAKKKPI
jgi:hypothetical protein